MVKINKLHLRNLDKKKTLKKKQSKTKQTKKKSTIKYQNKMNKIKVSLQLARETGVQSQVE